MNNDVDNPYAAPQSDTVAPLSIHEASQVVKLFSISGRIGRVRYIGYTLALLYVISTAGNLLGPITSGASGTLATLAVLVMFIMLSIQRCHDFNTPGAVAIVGVIPILNIVLWFIPGTKGSNNYGNQTQPNTAVPVILAGFFLAMLLAVIAIAIKLLIDGSSD